MEFGYVKFCYVSNIRKDVSWNPLGSVNTLNILHFLPAKLPSLERVGLYALKNWPDISLLSSHPSLRDIKLSAPQITGITIPQALESLKQPSSIRNIWLIPFSADLMLGSTQFSFLEYLISFAKQDDIQNFGGIVCGPTAMRLYEHDMVHCWEQEDHAFPPESRSFTGFVLDNSTSSEDVPEEPLCKRRRLV